MAEGNESVKPHSGGQTSVFFSYTREDQPRATPIIRLIEAAGFATWWDGLLEGGQRFSRATEEALDHARAVVVLWSKASVQSHWVRDEATRGRDRNILVPLSLDGTEPPLGFGQFQVIDLAKARMSADDVRIQQLIRAIAGLHDTPIAFPGPRQPVLTGWNRRKALGSGLALAAAGGGVLAWRAGVFGGATARNSVAVLPFANLSDDPAQRYFSEGLASEIRSQLSRNALLETAGQTSSNQFRETEFDVRSVARKLGVAFLLNGTVQKMGNRLKVATFLIDGHSTKNVWAETFERDLADVFAVQGEIASVVSRELTATIDARQAGKTEIPIGGTKSIAAFDAFLQGRDLFESHIDELSERAALAKFDQALAIDPHYAAARASRSRSLAIIANQYVALAERKTLYEEAVSEARRAADIAPAFAGGFIALGYALFYGRLDAKAARAPYERAAALGQGDVDVLSRYAVYCARTGNFPKAEAAIARAAMLDPLNPTMFKSAGNIKYAARAYGQAITLARKAIALNPKRSTLHGDIGNALLMMGDLDKAEAEFAQETNNLLALPGRAIVAHRRQDRQKTDTLLAALVGEFGNNGLYQQAQVAAQRGDANGAFTLLDKAYAETDSGLVYLLNDPLLDPLRGDGRYNNLLRTIGFV